MVEHHGVRPQDLRSRAGTHTTTGAVIAGTSTGNTTMTSLGKCTIPSGMLRPGDRLEIRADLSDQDSTSAFSFALSWGSVFLTARSGSGTETSLSARSDVFPASSVILTGTGRAGETPQPCSRAGGSNTNPPTGNIVVELIGQMSTTAAETVTLRSLTIVRLLAPDQPVKPGTPQSGV